MVLFVYAVAGVKLQSPAEMHPLGIPLIVSRPDLLGIGLVVTSVYTALRYWYYAILTSLSPLSARGALRRGDLPPRELRPPVIEDTLQADSGTTYLGQVAEREIKRYFPTIGRAHVRYAAEYQGGRFVIRFESIPLTTRFLVLLENVDYTAPIWVNGVALVAYGGVATWPIASLRRLLNI